jgi:hypothetical protein
MRPLYVQRLLKRPIPAVATAQIAIRDFGKATVVRGASRQVELCGENAQVSFEGRIVAGVHNADNHPFPPVRDRVVTVCCSHFTWKNAGWLGGIATRLLDANGRGEDMGARIGLLGHDWCRHGTNQRCAKQQQKQLPHFASPRIAVGAKAATAGADASLRNYNYGNAKTTGV